uniref:Uncharacterized protein n=1 Tax=Arundo donax TaxID=35708 RepID=A0A0A8ZUQ1_ARUDO
MYVQFGHPGACGCQEGY